MRSFVFIDGIDEVTHMFKNEEDITNAVHRVNTEADVVWVDGHSDYGPAFGVFWENYGSQITSKSTVMFLGDARNNYHSTNAWVIKETAKHDQFFGFTQSQSRIGILGIQELLNTRHTLTECSSAETCVN